MGGHGRAGAGAQRVPPGTNRKCGSTALYDRLGFTRHHDYQYRLVYVMAR